MLSGQLPAQEKRVRPRSGPSLPNAEPAPELPIRLAGFCQVRITVRHHLSNFWGLRSHQVPRAFSVPLMALESERVIHSPPWKGTPSPGQLLGRKGHRPWGQTYLGPNLSFSTDCGRRLARCSLKKPHL